MSLPALRRKLLFGLSVIARDYSLCRAGASSLKWDIGTTITYSGVDIENGWAESRQETVVDRPMLRSALRVLAVVLIGGTLSAGIVAAEGAPGSESEKSVVLGRMAVEAKALLDPTVPPGSCSEQARYPEIRVTVSNVRTSAGNLRLSLYGDQPKEWLEKGMKLLRYDIPARAGEMIVCMPLPRGNGVYGLAMLHDENGNGKTEIFSEGYGFSNNAKAFLKAPSFKKTAFSADGMRTDLNIKLRY